MRTFGGALAAGLLLSGCVVPQGAVVVQDFDHPETWPGPETLFEGAEERPIDAGNVNVTVLDGTHYAALYTGTPTDAKVLVLPVRPESP